MSVFLASPARAFIFVVPSVSFPDTVTVGQTFPAAIGIGNFSTPPESINFPVLPITQIDLVPACANQALDCVGGVEAAVFLLSATGLGVGPPSCNGTWTITEISPGRYRFIPPNGEGSLQLLTGEVCVVNFTAIALRLPTVDVNPAMPGVQTNQIASATASPLGPNPVRNSGSDQTTVLQALPPLTTLAAQSGPTIPATTTDTATLAAPPGAIVAPTGNIRFDLFGPNDPTCAGVPVFSSTVPVTAFGNYTTVPAPITAPGTYRWIATYSGDANYLPSTTACGDPLETVTFAAAPTQLVTVASPGGPPGTAVTDTATLSGGFNPTGTITFNLFGPNDPTCAGVPIFASTVPVAGNGNYVSAPPFVPPAVGTYNWTATYSGDINNAPSFSPCGAANESVTLQRVTPTIVTVAQTPVSIGQTVTDTATLAGGFNPTGTITFNLFGPNDPTCAGVPIFTSTVPVAGNGNYTSSPPFAPTAVGTYQWTAVYSGDANNVSVTSPCGAPNEQSVVQPAQPTIVTTATPTVVLGQPITDTASLAGGVAPTGTITFNLFGPNNPTCTGVPIFTSTVPVTGNGPYTSAPFTPTAVGTYQWTAVYSGDANNLTAISPCGAPNEQSIVTRVTPAIVTLATPTAAVGQPITDTATLSGGAAPTGTITFTLFGPGNPTCTGVPVFVSTVPVAGNGQYTSAPFTPTAPGAYNWIATYNGDVNNAAVATACGDPGETTQVTTAPVQIVTVASGPVTLTQPISDIATLSGGVAPTGTITFNLFGPNNPTCTGAPIFSSTVPVAGNGNYNSGPFTPVAPGSYQWVAFYSGDANNAPATSPCGAPNETSVVTVLPTIMVEKTADPLSRPEPGGDFTYTVQVTNTSTENLTITTLMDSVYGNLANRGTCTTAIGTVLTPGGTYTCAFTAPFTGNAGASLTDVVTVTGVNPAGVAVTDTDDAVVTITNVPPTVTVDKTAAPPSRPEPGGDFTYTVVVTNTSAEPVTITTLTDSVYGNLATRGTCTTALGTLLAAAPGPGNTYTCQFTAPFTGNAGQSLTDVVTVVVVDDDNTTATDTDDAIVTITDVLPTITVVKTADPLTRLEPGGDFTFTVVVTNTSIEPVQLTSLVDNIYGNLNGRGTCDVTPPPTLAANGGTYTCNFVGAFTGNAGASQTDIVTATAVDDDGDTATASDDAVVSILNVVPAILVEKDATPASLPEPGGNFTFNVRVTNTGIEPLTITSLTDNIYGNIATQGTCTTAIGRVLAPGASFTCSFTGAFNGQAGATQTDIVTVTGVDDDGTSVTDNDDATVTLTNVPPTVDVQKTANPASRPEPGGDFTYTVVVTNTSAEPVTITTLTDNVYGNLALRGTCTNAIGVVMQPAGTYTCTFTAPFTGNAGAALTDVVTVVVVDNENTTATDTDDAVVRITDVPPTVSVDKTANPLSRPEPGGTFTFTVVVTNTSAEPVTITSLTDNIYGNLVTRGTCTNAVGTILQPAGTYTCSFSAPFLGDAGASQTDIITVTVRDDEGTTATDTDDAVVTITNVPPTVVVDKTASPPSRPEPGGTFTFTVVVTNTSAEPVTITSLTDDVYGNLNGRGTCAIGARLAAAPGPGNTYTCSFPGSFIADAGARQTDTVTVVVIDNDNSTATDTDDATVNITDVLPTIAVTKTASPGSLLAPGGTFTFTVVVTNTSIERVTITSLVDDIYGNLNGRGTCAIGAVLEPSASYSCSFPGEFRGEGGASQTDTVTATAVDNEGNPTTDQAKAQVRIEAVPVVPVPKPVPKVIAFTGSELDGAARMASALLVVGGLMIAATYRSGGGLAFALSGGWSSWRWLRGPEPPDAGPLAFFRGPNRPGGGGSGRPGSTALRPPSAEAQPELTEQPGFLQARVLRPSPEATGPGSAGLPSGPASGLGLAEDGDGRLRPGSPSRAPRMF